MPNRRYYGGITCLKICCIELLSKNFDFVTTQ